MAKFHVVWEIDSDAETSEAAAREAREAQSPGSQATVFKVTDINTGAVTEVDLDELDWGTESSPGA